MKTLLLDRYQIVKSLGSGGFGETFLAKDTQIPSQRLVVVKRLKPANASNSTSTELIEKLFEKEAAVLEELGNNSSQIPKLYSYFSNNDEFYLVQEYIQGKSLNDIAPVGTEQAKTIISSLITTLKYIHSKGIIHRDIKPENIIIRDSDHLPVLIDFGAVKETMGTVTLGSGSTVSSVVIGTRGFMAPEQSAGRSVFSTDLYALGLTTIYAMTKKLPVEFATSQLTGELDWQSHVPGINTTLARVIDKAIQMEPSRRYPTAEAMYQDLHSLISSGAGPVTPMETVRVAPSNEFLVTGSSVPNYDTVVAPISNSYNNQNGNGKSKIATLLTVLIGIIVIAGGLGGGFVITQQIKEAEARAEQAEKDKQEAERKRIEAEQKIAAEEKRQKELEAQRIEEERQRLAAEANRAKQERQRLAAERQKVQVLANQARATASGATASIGGIPGTKNIRSGPGTDYGVVSQGYTGEGLDILDSSTDSGGHVWYKVYHYNSGSTGWMASQLVDF